VSRSYPEIRPIYFSKLCFGCLAVPAVDECYRARAALFWQNNSRQTNLGLKYFQIEYSGKPLCPEGLGIGTTGYQDGQPLQLPKVGEMVVETKKA
jgi:hypothetical protein